VKLQVVKVYNIAVKLNSIYRTVLQTYSSERW